MKRLIDYKIKEFGYQDHFESTLTEIRSKEGSLILFEGLRQNVDSVKSLEGVDICWVEEAQTISDNSIETLNPTIRKPGSEIWVTWNPRLQNDPIDVLFRNDLGPPPKSIVRKVNYDSNPYFPDVLRDEMEWDKRRSPDKYKHIWLGEYRTHSEARVFHNWKVESFETPTKVDRFYFGADWGFSVDPTTLIRCYIQGRTIFIDSEAYKVGCPIEQTPSLFRTVPESMKWPLVADSARPETIKYMRDHGFKMYPATKGSGSVEDGIEFLKNYDLVVHPRCTHMADELAMFSYKIDKQTNEILPVIEDANNHCLTGDTVIDTFSGPIQINDLVGTTGKVVSVDAETGLTSIETFSEVRKTRESAAILEIEMEDGRTIQVTDDHLVLTQRGWVAAKELTDADFLASVR